MQRAKRRLGPIVCLSRGDAANSGQAKADPAGDEDYHAARRVWNARSRRCALDAGHLMMLNSQLRVLLLRCTGRGAIQRKLRVARIHGRPSFRSLFPVPCLASPCDVARQLWLPGGERGKPSYEGYHDAGSRLWG